MIWRSGLAIAIYSVAVQNPVPHGPDAWMTYLGWAPLALAVSGFVLGVYIGIPILVVIVPTWLIERGEYVGTSVVGIILVGLSVIIGRWARKSESPGLALDAVLALIGGLASTVLGVALYLTHLA